MLDNFANKFGEIVIDVETAIISSRDAHIEIRDTVESVIKLDIVKIIVITCNLIKEILGKIDPSDVYFVLVMDTINENIKRITKIRDNKIIYFL